MKKALFIGLAAIIFVLVQLPIVPKSAVAQLGIDTGGDVIEKATQELNDITGHWAESNIREALKRGYVEGYPSGKFLPDNMVSRAEFVKMTVTALGLQTHAEEGPWYTPYVKAAESAGIYKLVDFADFQWTNPITREEMSKIAVRSLGITNIEADQWMYLAAKNGIISGTAPGELTPEGNTTRAQAIAVIERVRSVKNGQLLPVDKYAVAAAEMYWHRTNIFTVAEELFNRPENVKYTADLGMKSWKAENLTLEAEDGSLKARVESLTAIDWNDLNDPNRKLLPSTDKLVWSVGGRETPFTDDMEVYVILLDSKLVVNENPEFFPVNRLALSILGYSEKRDGINMATLIQSKDPDKEVYGLVIPKDGFHTNGKLTIMVQTISSGAWYGKTLSTSVLAK